MVESFRSSIGSVQGWAICELDEVCTNIHDRMMLVRQHSHDHVMSWRRFWWFLGQNSSFKMAQWFAMDSMAQNWLHRRTGVITRVYVHFLRWVWHALSRCFEHQCMCRHVRHTGVFDMSLHYFLQTPPPQVVHMRSCMRNLFIGVGRRRWGGSASLCKSPFPGVGNHFLTRGNIEVLSVFYAYFDRDGSICGCMCVYMHTHTHRTWDTGMWAQGSGRDTWRARRIQMD